MMTSRTTTDCHNGYPLTDLLTYQGTFRNTYGVNNIFENVAAAREPIAELRTVFSIYFGVEPPKQYQRILHANLKQ